MIDDLFPVPAAFLLKIFIGLQFDEYQCIDVILEFLRGQIFQDRLKEMWLCV